MDRLLARPNRSIYLALLRLFICFHLIKKVALQWTSLDIVYGTNSFFVPQNDPLFELLGLHIDFFRANYELFIFAFVLLTVFYAFGIGKHATAAAIYVFVEILQRSNHMILNGGDNLLKFVLLYMIFVNSYEYFCINKLRIKNAFLGKLSNLLTNLGTFSILIHLCLVYGFSGLAKTNADLWFNGVATYYTLSLERFMGTSFNDALARNGYLVTITTYVTLLWELYFPVLIWFKKLRIYVLLVGAMLHSGIYVTMMIHDFQILFISLYGLFFTDAELRRAWQYVIEKLPLGKLAPRLKNKPTPPQASA